MVLEDGSFILKTGTARGIFSFGRQEILIYHSEAQIHVLVTSKQSILTLKIEGREGRKRRGRGRAREWVRGRVGGRGKEGVLLSIRKDLEQPELSYFSGWSIKW